MSPEVIAAILAGLTSLVTALGIVGQNRSRKFETQFREQGEALAEQQAYTKAISRQLTLAERYIARLERALSSYDLDLPSPPEGFGDDHDLAPPATARRRHRAEDTGQ